MKATENRQSLTHLPPPAHTHIHTAIMPLLFKPSPLSSELQ